MYTGKRKVVIDLIRKFGVTQRYRGYSYTIEATLAAMQSIDAGMLITKDVYPVLAKRYGVSVAIIERNIRSVAGMCWSNNKELLETIANYPLPKRPSNSEFLDILTYYVSTLEK